ncbi:hypothetical protein [Gloeothece verrucosa]|uniref:Uncharacterized protein n=1 Tax=Gloeothece verrucosa (strain PCC 7822) TaxID=497965 RepID=E0UNN5_GLOV7|nr:hypothetical protein [Gloeothece verrucosa]ADN18565.1 hypothetical protein Cyan7822_6924 [Gloeothece verrucosa PCC 7822]
MTSKNYHVRYNPLSDEINWSKYYLNLRDDYTVIEIILFEGIKANAEQVRDLNFINVFLIKFKEFVEKYWIEFEFFNKRNMARFSHEILEYLEKLKKSNVDPSSKLIFRLLWQLSKRVVGNSSRFEIFFNSHRLKTIKNTWKIAFSNNSSRTTKLELSIIKNLIDLANTVVILADLEKLDLEPKFYETATHEEWSRALREWAAGQVHPGPPLSHEAIKRENIYDDEYW